MENKTEYCNCLFEQPWWLDLVASKRWEEVVVKDDRGDVAVRMAYVNEHGKIYMPRFTQTLGIWENPKIRNDYGKRKRCYYELFEKINKIKNVQICLDPSNEYVLPFKWMGYVIEPRFTYRINNLSDPEKIYSEFNKTAKKNIKYANNKVKIFSEIDIDCLWNMLNKTFEIQNRKNPMSKDILYKIISYCEEKGHGKYFEAKDSEKNIHSCAYFVYDEKICYYLIGASDSNYRSSGAQSLVLWEGIKFASQKSRIFDFEGSSIEGIENFFRQFNSVCTPYYSIRKNGFISDIAIAAKPRIKKLIGYKL